MTDTAIQPEHAEIESLLPWFVNGTLTAAESNRVAEHLQGCTECSDALQECRRVAKVVAAESATPLVPSPPVDEFLKMIERQKSKGESRKRWSAVALAASVLVILTAGFVFFAADQEETPQVFHTVSNGGTDASVAYVFNIAYLEGAEETVRRSMANQFTDAELVEFSGGYRMVIPLQSATMADLEAFADSLQAIQGVQQVDVVGVQLPLE